MTLKDFRKLPEAESGRFSYGLALEVRAAWERRQVVLDLLEELGEEPQELKLSGKLADDPEELARKARNLLRISSAQQMRWRNVYETLNSWKDALEDLGILVFETQHTSRISLDEMRGFSISADTVPVVVANSKDAPRGKAFTLLHELSHLLLRNGGICDLEEYRRVQNEKERIEVFCNHVAGAILLPKDLLLSDALVREKESKADWADDELVALSQRYSVSREVVLRRLLILKRTTSNFYRQKRREFLDAYKKQREEQEGYAPYYRMMLRSHGRLYTRLVLNSYYQDVITVGDVSEYLNLKLKHLPKIEAELFG